MNLLDKVLGYALSIVAVYIFVCLTLVQNVHADNCIVTKNVNFCQDDSGRTYTNQYYNQENVETTSRPTHYPDPYFKGIRYN